ncbi:hypothetical protein Tco_0215458 [Tanacetum coccineum]
MKANTVKPIVNNARPKADFHKSVLPFRKSFIITTALRTNFSKQKVNTAEVNAVSAVVGKWKTAVKTQTAGGCRRDEMQCKDWKGKVYDLLYNTKSQSIDDHKDKNAVKEGIDKREVSIEDFMMIEDFMLIEDINDD